MAEDIFVALFVAKHNVPDAFEELVSRMAYSVKEMKLCTEYVLNSKSIASDISSNELKALVKSIQNTNKAIMIEGMHKLSSGRDILVELSLYGKKYEGGYHYKKAGPIEVHVSINDLSRPLKEIVDRKTVHPDLKPSRHFIEITKSAIMDADSFFMEACGLERNSKCEIQHGLLYSRINLRSPAICSMVYHKDLKEFAKDLYRTYTNFNSGTPLPVMFEKDITMWTDYKSKPSKNDIADIYPIFNDSELQDFITFLSSMRVEIIKEALNLPSNMLREYLTNLINNMRDIECYDFGKDGLIISSNPMSSVWKVYKYLYKILR